MKLKVEGGVKMNVVEGEVEGEGEGEVEGED